MPRQNCGAYSRKGTGRLPINRRRSNNRFPTNRSRSTRRPARKQCGRSRHRARRVGYRRRGGAEFDQVKVRGRLVGPRPRARSMVEWMTKASVDDQGFVVTAFPPVVEAVRTGQRITAISLRVASLGPAGPAISSPSRVPRPDGAGRLRNLQRPFACAEAIVRKGEWAAARARMRARKPIALDRLSDWL